MSPKHSNCSDAVNINQLECTPKLLRVHACVLCEWMCACECVCMCERGGRRWRRKQLRLHLWRTVREVKNWCPTKEIDLIIAESYEKEIFCMVAVIKAIVISVQMLRKKQMAKTCSVSSIGIPNKKIRVLNFHPLNYNLDGWQINCWKTPNIIFEPTWCSKSRSAETLHQPINKQEAFAASRRQYEFSISLHILIKFARSIRNYWENQNPANYNPTHWW